MGKADFDVRRYDIGVPRRHLGLFKIGGRPILIRLDRSVAEIPRRRVFDIPAILALGRADTVEHLPAPELFEMSIMQGARVSIEFLDRHEMRSRMMAGMSMPILKVNGDLVPFG